MSQRHALKMVPLALIALLLMSPAGAFAHEKDGKGKSAEKRAEKSANIVRAQNVDRQEKQEKNEKKERSSCVKAFGHLIAPGWLRVKAGLDGGARCELPFGIGKKLNGTGTATSTADVKAPVITNVATVAGAASVGIGWRTNEPATSKVFYSAATPVNIAATGTASVGASDLTTIHFVVVPGLATSTTYYFVAESKDAAGNTKVTSEFSATTAR